MIPVDHTERNIGALLHVLGRLVTEVFGQSTLSEITSFSLTQAQFSMLTLLEAAGRRNISELCRIHNISPPAGTKNIDKLESLGLAVRNSINGDRRMVWVEITPAGQKLVRKYHQQYLHKVKQALSELGDRDKLSLVTTLESIIRRGIEISPLTSLICLQCHGRFSDSCIMQEHFEHCLFLGKEVSHKPEGG